MAESVCLRRSFSNPSEIIHGFQEGDSARALGESASFGRYMSESLSWERWSAFSRNRYLEEAEKYSKPGSVAKMKAFFEAHYNRVGVKKRSAQEEANKETTNNVEPNGQNIMENSLTSDVKETSSNCHTAICEIGAKRRSIVDESSKPKVENTIEDEIIVEDRTPVCELRGEKTVDLEPRFSSNVSFSSSVFPVNNELDKDVRILESRANNGSKDGSFEIQVHECKDVKENRGEFPEKKVSQCMKVEEKSDIINHTPDKNPPVKDVEKKNLKSNRKSADSPLKQQRQKIEDSPLKQQRQKTEDSPLKQQRQKTEDSPLKQQRRKTKDSPLKQQGRKIEDSPLKQQRQKTEDSPLKQQGRKIEDSPLKQQGRKKEDSPMKRQRRKSEDSPMKQSVKSNISKLSSSLARLSTPVRPKMEGRDTPDGRKLGKESVDKRKSGSRLANVSTNTDVKKTSPMSSRKAGIGKILTPLGKIIRNRFTSPAPSRESRNSAVRHPYVTPQSEVKRSKVALEKSFSKSKALDQNLKSSATGNTNTSAQSTSVYPFKLRTEERAAKRRELLQKKLEKEAETLQQPSKLKTETSKSSLGVNVKASTSTDIRSEVSSDNTRKIASPRTLLPKSESKPASDQKRATFSQTPHKIITSKLGSEKSKQVSTESTTKPSSEKSKPIPTRSSSKLGLEKSKPVPVQSNSSSKLGSGKSKLVSSQPSPKLRVEKSETVSTKSSTMPSMKKRHENTSPNIL